MRGGNVGLRCGAVLAALALAGCAKGGDATEARRARQSNAPGPPAIALGINAAPKMPGQERHIVALGDSLFAGYGLRPAQAYPQRLQAALRARAINVFVANAGVSGDTTADGLARLSFTLSAQAEPPTLVLICLGGNDMLRGLPPAQTRANLDAILAELDRRHIPAMVMGMLAAPNLGADYTRAFNAIYPALAKQHHAALVPFFLDAVIRRDDLRQADHVHPTARGVEALVGATLAPTVKALAAHPGKS